MTDRQAEQATQEQVRALVMAGVRAGADLRPAALADDWPGDPCPDCGAPDGDWCQPNCPRYHDDPGEAWAGRRDE